ncbi:MAG: hypothetical protein ACP5R4_06705 [Armatimonadota bacterium]
MVPTAHQKGFKQVKVAPAERASFTRRGLFCRAAVVLPAWLLALRGSAFAAGGGVRMTRPSNSSLVFSTLFTAQDVNNLLKDDEGRRQAVDFCRSLRITKVYLETFRGEYAREELLTAAKDLFLREGFQVSGCVTTVSFGKKSTGWDLISCYTSKDTQEKLEEIFRFTARLFDEIMIDDFLFTDCECEECRAAKGSKSWAEYRLSLMLDVSKSRILKPSHEVNPNAKVIIKYPQWYDNFHNRGYGVDIETAAFDRIWVGTETRNPDAVRWGAKQQYEAYFIYRWLSAIGGAKTGGGWFDTYDCSPEVYVEQAYQTVLAGAPEVFLFHYGDLINERNRPLIDRLKSRQELLYSLAPIARTTPLRGIAAYKPPNSDPQGEDYIFDFIGMLGIPLVPTHQFPGRYAAAFFSLHALHDKGFASKFFDYLKRGRTAVITSGLANRLREAEALSQVPLDWSEGSALVHKTPWGGSVIVLPVKQPFTSLYSLPQDNLDRVRSVLLRASAGIEMLAPPRVALYLFGNRYAVIENFNDRDVDVRLDFGPQASVKAVLPKDAPQPVKDDGAWRLSVPKRELVVLRR